MKKRISLFNRFFLILNIITAFCLLISYAAGFVDPVRLWPVAFFGLIYPILIIANLVFVCFWLLKLNRYVLISVLVLLAGWGIHKNVFNLNFSKPEQPGKDDLRVMSYNVHEFRSLNNDHDLKTKSQMLGIILKEQPSLICFQEFYTRDRGKYAILDSIKRFSAAKHVFYKVIARNDIESIGMAIFSRYPIIRSKFIPFTSDGSGNSCIYIDISYGKDTIRVFNVHLQSIKFMPEDYRYFNMLKQQLDPDMESSKKIGSKLKRAFIKRSTHAHIVAAELKKSPYKVILCGDFNDTPVSYSYRIISKGLKNAFTEKGSGYGITYGGAFPNMQIDYILSDPAFHILNYKVVRKNLSDHYPVVSEIALSDK